MTLYTPIHLCIHPQAIKTDPSFRKFAEEYAADEKKFFEDFAVSARAQPSFARLVKHICAYTLASAPHSSLSSPKNLVLATKTHGTQHHTYSTRSRNLFRMGARIKPTRTRAHTRLPPKAAPMYVRQRLVLKNVVVFGCPRPKLFWFIFWRTGEYLVKPSASASCCFIRCPFLSGSCVFVCRRPRRNFASMPCTAALRSV